MVSILREHKRALDKGSCQMSKYKYILLKCWTLGLRYWNPIWQPMTNNPGAKFNTITKLKLNLMWFRCCLLLNWWNCGNPYVVCKKQKHCELKYHISNWVVHTFSQSERWLPSSNRTNSPMSHNNLNQMLLLLLRWSDDCWRGGGILTLTQWDVCDIQHGCLLLNSGKHWLWSDVKDCEFMACVWTWHLIFIEEFRFLFWTWNVTLQKMLDYCQPDVWSKREANHWINWTQEIVYIWSNNGLKPPNTLG